MLHATPAPAIEDHAADHRTARNADPSGRCDVHKQPARGVSLAPGGLPSVAICDERRPSTEISTLPELLRTRAAELGDARFVRDDRRGLVLRRVPPPGDRDRRRPARRGGAARRRRRRRAAQRAGVPRGVVGDPLARRRLQPGQPGPDAREAIGILEDSGASTIVCEAAPRAGLRGRPRRAARAARARRVDEGRRPARRRCARTAPSPTRPAPRPTTSCRSSTPRARPAGRRARCSATATSCPTRACSASWSRSVRGDVLGHGPAAVPRQRPGRDDGHADAASAPRSRCGSASRPRTFWDDGRALRAGDVLGGPDDARRAAARARRRRGGDEHGPLRRSAAPRRCRRRCSSASRRSSASRISRATASPRAPAARRSTRSTARARSARSACRCAGRTWSSATTTARPRADGEPGRGVRPRAERHAGLSQPPRRERRDAARRLAAHRRRRLPRRRRLHLPRRPQEGHDHPRRREHLPARDRGRPARARRRPGRRGGRPPGRGARRGGARGRRAGRRAPTWTRSSEHCRERLAPFKVPSTWEVVDDLPKTSTGKIDKKPLRDRVRSAAAA